MTQLDAVLNYIKVNGSITSFEAFMELGCTRLSGRIYELKKRGYKFKTETITTKNRYGKYMHYFKYSLIQ